VFCAGGMNMPHAIDVDERTRRPKRESGRFMFDSNTCTRWRKTDLTRRA